MRDKWVREKGMKVFSVYDPQNPYFLLDVFVEEPFDFDKVYEERKNIKAGNVRIPLVPIKRLIEMKKKVGRPQDIADVYYLRKIEKEWGDEERDTGTLLKIRFLRSNSLLNRLSQYSCIQCPVNTA